MSMVVLIIWANQPRKRRTGEAWAPFPFHVFVHLMECGRRLRTWQMRRGMEGRGSVALSRICLVVCGQMETPVLQLAVACLTQESIILNDALLVVDEPKLTLC